MLSGTVLAKVTIVLKASIWRSVLHAEFECPAHQGVTSVGSREAGTARVDQRRWPLHFVARPSRGSV